MECKPLCSGRMSLALDAERDVDGRAVLGNAVVFDHGAHRDDVRAADPAQRPRRLLNGRVGGLGEALG